MKNFMISKFDPFFFRGFFSMYTDNFFIWPKKNYE
jgi:hypothetical protein